jgi:hypothetical protein
LLAELNPTQDTVNRFKARFVDRFPGLATQARPVFFDVEMAEMKQDQDETLPAYYR